MVFEYFMNSTNISFMNFTLCILWKYLFYKFYEFYEYSSIFVYLYKLIEYLYKLR